MPKLSNLEGQGKKMRRVVKCKCILYFHIFENFTSSNASSFNTIHRCNFLNSSLHFIWIIFIWIEKASRCWWQCWCRCWWRLLKTKCVGDNFKMLLTVLAILVTNCESPTPRCHQHHNVTNMTIALPGDSQTKFEFRNCAKLILSLKITYLLTDSLLSSLKLLN